MVVTNMDIGNEMFQWEGPQIVQLLVWNHNKETTKARITGFRCDKTILLTEFPPGIR